MVLFLVFGFSEVEELLVVGEEVFAVHHFYGNRDDLMGWRNRLVDRWMSLAQLVVVRVSRDPS